MKNWIKAASRTMEAMSKCAIKSPCGTLGLHLDWRAAKPHQCSAGLAEETPRDAGATDGRKRPYDAKQVVILKRKVQWTRHEFWLAPDPRHVKDIVEELGLTQAPTSRHSDACESVQQSGPQLARISAHEVQHCVGDRWRKRTTRRWIAQTIATQHRSPLSQKKKDILKLKRVGPLFIGGPNTWTHCRREVQSERNHGVHRQRLGG